LRRHFRIGEVILPNANAKHDTLLTDKLY